MADQSKKSGGGNSPYAELPGLYDIIAAEEARLGIDDASTALSPDEKEAVVDRLYAGIATPVGKAVKDAKDIVWIVKNVLAAGGLYMLAGTPKKAKKSLLCIEMCLCISRGAKFLGMPTKKGRAIFANFEDGYERCVRRLRDFGVSPDTLDEVDLVANRQGFAALCVYIKWRKPMFVVLDPTMEIELLLGCRDENKSDQIAKMVGDLRELTRSAGTTILMPHHVAKGTQNIRGSSAFEGSLDGWVYVRQAKDGSLYLEVTNRDSEEMKIPFSITFDAGVTIVAPVGEPTVGPLPENTERGGGGKKGDKKDTKFAGPTNDQARAALLVALLNSTDGLGWDDRRAAARVGADKLREIQGALVQDGLVEQKGRKMLLTDKGKATAAEQTKAAAAKSTAQPAEELIGRMLGDDESSES